MTRHLLHRLMFAGLLLCVLPTAALAQWDTPSRAFHKDTAFKLDGKHQTVPCASCHLNGVTKGTPQTCSSCHWVRRQDDPYRTLLGSQCEQCHRTSSWTAVRWDHAEATGMPLNPSHKMLDCTSCHKNRVFTGANGSCVSCHRKDYDATSTPNHAAAGFSTQCTECHKPSDAAFNQTRFNHNAAFPLVGLHAAQNCASCHVNGRYQGTPRDCVGCHRPNYDRTTKPNHASAGFSTSCDGCHKPTDTIWKGATASINHNAFFPLAGLHATADCASCHTNGRYAGTPRDCVGCHRTNYDRTTSPNHAAAGYATTCDSCHRASDTAWRGGAVVNHNAFFPLVGQHAAAVCTTCHLNNRYQGTPRDCVGCHRTNYDRTTSPNHAAAGYSTSCESCHRATDAAWKGAAVNHYAFFPLVGLHATAACTQCHVGNVYKGTPRDCVGCHRTTYDKTTSPNHAAAGYSTACDTCHRAAEGTWTGAAVNHNAFFPLVGNHAVAACATCHVNNRYQGTPRDCVGCHRTNYDRTTSPNHAAAGYATTCDSCHKATDSSWKGATFNHTQYFTLSGLHATASCVACHVNNVYKGTPRECYPCHTTQYQNTTNPNHLAAKFPTTCETCHKATDSVWTQGKFTHSWFPITSGKHAGNACSACHNNPSNYTVFTCLTCHGKAQTDSHHQGRNGYRYESAACYSCHPTGRS